MIILIVVMVVIMVVMLVMVVVVVVVVVVDIAIDIVGVTNAVNGLTIVCCSTSALVLQHLHGYTCECIH